MNTVPWYLAVLILTTAQLLTNATPTREQLNSIFLRLYNGSLTDYIDVSVANASFIVPKMNNTNPTAFYIHGFTESVEKESVRTVVSAYLQRGDHNIIAVDYRNISTMSYTAVVASVPEVGAEIAKGLNTMVKSGLDEKKVHIIGHSMGAQVAVYIGNNTIFRVPRITGLDPAGPLFNLKKSHLSADDASFVDIIHTDAGFYGTGRMSGTTDMLPNYGHRIQPGCPSIFAPLSNEDFCSHHRSWRFYAESLKDEFAFIAVQCPFSLPFAIGLCNNNEKVPMGYATPNTTKGTYYLITNSASPYGRKEAGAKA